jgi:hypothetical protein
MIHSNHRRAGLTVGALLLPLLGGAPVVQALDAIVLEVRELVISGIPVEGAGVRLDVLSEKHTRLAVSARGATLPDPAGKLTDIRWTCDQPVVAEPRFGCDTGKLTARGGPTGSVDMKLAALMRTDSGVTSFSGSGLKLAGTTASFDGTFDASGWQVKGHTGVTTIPALRKFAEPWLKLPADITIAGKVAVEVAAADKGKGTSADIAAKLDGVELTNEASTVVAEKLNATAQVHARLNDADTGLEVQLTGTGGQALFGPVLLDLAKNPLHLDMRGTLREQVLTLDALRFTQKNLIEVAGAGRVNLAGDIPLVTGDFKLAKLEFPSAYTSYMQITLAASVLGDLATSGSVNGELSIADNGVGALHLSPDNLEMRDGKGRLFLSKVNGDVYWSPAGVGAARVSKLAWDAGGAYGLSGGATELEFVAYGMNFALARPAKLPVFDGAIAIESFAMGNIGADDMQVSFMGAVEPISMKLLAKAFDWPEFSGTLAARIPGVTLKDNVLTFDGNLESQVFGGRITGSNIRLKDPLGNFPEFFADVRARDLDLELVTRTFEVGSITGKLEADVLGLQLFAWTPQAFDARLATPKGDKSRHRISAKAVSSLSNVGGGGGGVVQALQSGVLKFFDEYSYEKLGITCKLRGDICEMAGIEPAGVGYYIVKGAGLPRIDIVGNAGRVSWNQLVSSITTTEFSDARAVSEPVR